jgi:hypothetical protein
MSRKLYLNSGLGSGVKFDSKKATRITKIITRPNILILFLKAGWRVLQLIILNDVSMKHSKLGLIISLFFSACIFLYNSGCNDSSSGGELLAKRYCASCHLYPDPQLLPKYIWKESILPTMGGFANLYVDESGNYSDMSNEMINSKLPFFKNIRFSVSKQDWNAIVKYYLMAAPDKLASNDSPVSTSLSGFDIVLPGKKRKANTSCIFIDTSRSALFVGDMNKPELYIYDTRLKLIHTIDSSKAVVNISPLKKQNQAATEYLITNAGSFSPSPYENKGFVELIRFDHDRISRKKLIDSLNRPVQSISTDVDGDGLMDIIVCEFGYLQGQLSLFKNTGKGYIKKTLSTLPGAEKIIEEDINHDGRPDFWVLFAAAYEGIIQFINKGNDEFEQKEILSFPPCYGSTSFSLVDFNNDGKKDILYTCGDNADLSPILKPYHGIYLFENTGKDFKQSFFYHMDGCYKAVAADFDQDGKLDIAAISFFADYEKRPEGGFELLHNSGDNKFVASTFPSVNSGRWICMDVNDYDHDGDIDIILGNLGAKPGNDKELMHKWLDGPEFLVLRNNLIRR